MKRLKLLIPLCVAAVTGLSALFTLAQNQPAAVVPNDHAIPLTSIVPDGKPHKFEARGKQFSIDGQPTLLVAGEMHFGRTLPEDWELRVKQAKAMGLNTLSFYLFWNLVEPTEGKFEFTGMTDVRRMLKICQDNGMWVILRPGPYCCAEVEYGGIPWWTLKSPDVKIRTNDPTYVEWSRKYIEQVYKQVADLQVTKGGPLLMVQVENEYGMVAAGSYDYMKTLRQIFVDVGFEVPLFVCDPFVAGAAFGARRGGATASAPATPPPPPVNPYGEGMLRGRNGLKSDADYRSTVAAIGDFPVYAPEVYTAWFTGWGQPIATRNATLNGAVSWTNSLLNNNASFCYYMFFGGTTFGFFNGCNEYLPVVTSYDYGAPVDEAGRTTDKYRALRELLSTRLKINPPAVPPEPAVIEIPAIRLMQSEPLIETLPSAPTRVSEKPVSMENLDQAYGAVLYRKKFPAGIKGTLELKQAQDYAIVMVNGKTVGKAFRGYGPESSKITLNEEGPATLDVLVYNLGRISVIVNSRSPARAAKGLIDGAYLDDKELNGWDIYSLPMENFDNFKHSTAPHTGPTIYRGSFALNQLGGSFLDMRNWGMGAVWVNGHNLGRYWDRGGLRTVFVPSHWLRQGQNDIVIMELHDAPKLAEVTGGTKIIEEPAVPFAVRLDRAQ